MTAVYAQGLQVLSTEMIDKRISDYLVSSESLVKPAHVRFTLPANYHDNPQQRYPVLYLLYGGGADHKQWTELGSDTVSSDANVIIVQPYGGRGSWYRDA